MNALEEDALHQNDEGPSYKVGFRRPPLHTRFKPGVSGNPSGRPKDSKNFKTLLHLILNEQISLQEGSQSRKISKAEAIMRRRIERSKGGHWEVTPDMVDELIAAARQHRRVLQVGHLERFNPAVVAVEGPQPL